MIKEFYNKDCMEVMEKMPDKCVDLTITDIPYEYHEIIQNTHEMQWTKDGRYISKAITRKTQLADTSANRLNFDLKDFLDQLLRVTKNVIIIFCSLQQAGFIFDYFTKLKEENGGSVRDMVWEKSNIPVLTSMQSYGENLEHFILYRLPKAPSINKILQSSCLHYPQASNKIHPMEKNHELLKQLILDNSQKGDIVFDPLFGSGSTLLVALQCGRSAIGCELDPKYYQDALNRLQDKGNYQFDLLEDYQ